jgi:hypothetical protein
MTTRIDVLRLGALVGAALLGACAASGGGGGDDHPDSGPIPEEDLIDDLEDGDGAIHEINGRIGSWYTFNDETPNGTQMPLPNSDFLATEGGAGGSLYAARTAGSGFTEWGAGMGLDVNNPGDPMGGPGIKGKFDASGYTGVSFKAKGNTSVRAVVVTAAVVPMEAGGECTPSTVEGMMCDDAHGRPIALSDEWKEYDLPFAQLTQEGWGKPAEFDPTKVTGVMFIVGANVDFEVVVDDVRFY